MPAPDLDFARIRPLQNSRNLGFEELCCQLAALEPAPDGSLFRRKGEGPDGGLECFRILPDGTETGWQAKYVPHFKAGQVADLDDSLTRALGAHPNLARFVVCLPIDLNDPRIGKQHTPLERFEAWRARRIAQVEATGGTLEIVLWGRSELIGLLTRNEPAYAGKRLYWFDERTFTPAWFKARLETPIANLDDRYQPQNHIDLMLTDTLRILVRDPAMMARPLVWADALRLAVRDVREAGVFPVSHREAAATLEAAATSLVDLLLAPPARMKERVAVEAWDAQAEALHDVLTPLFEAAWFPGETSLVPFKTPLYALKGALDDVFEALEAEDWPLSNDRLLLVSGEAGAGKSHLLADFVTARCDAGFPALLVLGGTLVNGDPWRQLIDGWDLPGVSRETVLGALDAAAEATGGRAVLVVDALNEGPGTAFWRTHLRGFVQAVAAFPRIVVILSCRTIYLPGLGLSPSAPDLPRLEHPGFAQDNAAERYLAMRGVDSPGMPVLGPELSNPLFLKTCCDLLERRQLTRFPDGIRGVTSIFDFYIDAITFALQERMGLDPLQSLPEQAISTIAEALAVRPGGRLSMTEAARLLESLLPSHGRSDSSLLHQLVAENVLTVEEDPATGLAGRTIRFAFERFSDHMIARHLLDTYWDAANPSAAFQAGPLADKVFGPDATDWAGVVEAIAVHLPERSGLELPDARPQPDCTGQVFLATGRRVRGQQPFGRVS
jgi:hypothetical protein